MARYLARLANRKGLGPKDGKNLAKQIRELLGSKEAIGHLRVSSVAIEFDLFANDQDELENRRKLLENEIAKLLTLKPLDKLPAPRDKLDVLREGIELFNEERFWECHEVLEQIWHPAKGAERDIIQGMIQTAAAFVHHQKEEDETCLSMLKKARSRLDSKDGYEGVDLKHLRTVIDRMLKAGRVEVFRIPF